MNQQNNKTPQGTRSRQKISKPISRTGVSQNAYKSRAKRMQKRRAGILSAAAICLIIMIFVSMSLLIVRSVNWEEVFSDKSRKPFENPENLVYGPYLTKEERDGFLTQYVTVSEFDLYRGSCILVNNDTAFRFSETDPTGTEYENVFSIYKNKTNSYKVSNGSLFLQMEAIHALNDWMDSFYEETENRNIMVNTAYRTYKQQKDIYDDYVATYGVDYANRYAQLPGNSEHHTGYAIDLAVYDEGDPDVEEDGGVWKFDGQQEYFLAAQTCSRYGWVLRYSASKEDVTKIAYESWHYRYVGIGNALMMQNLGLSLEEYINYIRDYAYDGTKEYITADNGDI